LTGTGNRDSAIFLAMLVVVSGFFCFLIYLQPDFFNHNSEYQWRVLNHGTKSALVWVPVLWTAILSAAFWLGSKFLTGANGAKANALAAGMIFLLGLASPLVFSQVNRFGADELLVRVFVADHTGYFTDAVKYRNRANLVKAYRENFSSLSTHSRTHPPADALLFMALNRAAEKSPGLRGIYEAFVNLEDRKKIESAFGIGEADQAGGWLALVMMMLAAALSAVFGYFLARKFFPAELSLTAGLILVTLPAFSAKTPVMDQVFSVFILGATLAAVGGRERKWGRGLAAGLIVGAGAWLSPGVWCAAILAPLLLAAEDLNSGWGANVKNITRDFLVIGIPALLGALAMIELGQYLAGMSYREVFELGRQGWHLNNAASGRVAVWKWMVFNPYEYFFWCSLPVFMGFLASVLSYVNSIWEKAEFIGKERNFLAASILFMLALDLSGQICYESPRLFWFFLPIVAVISTFGLAKTVQNLHKLAFGAIFLTISFQTALMCIIY